MMRTFLVAYLALAATTSLLIGTVRSLSLFAAGTLPDQYLLHGVLLNAGLAGALALVLAPGALLGAWIGRRWLGLRPTTLAALAAVACVYLPFWVLNTQVPYRAPLAGGLAPIAWDAARWLSGLLGVGVVFAWTLSGGSRSSLLARCGALCAVLVVLGLGLRGYAALSDPSRTAPMGIEASAEDRPHVFLVLVDTLRADHVGAYGYHHDTTPQVDAMAADGTVYTRAFAQAPWTRPSVGALLTSRYPPEIGLRGMWNPLPSDVPILPQFLRVEGYATGGVVSSVHLSAQYGFDKGWDELDIGITYLRWTGVQNAFGRLRLMRRGEVYPRYEAKELTDRAIAWLDDRLEEDPERPVFMYLHYSDPHTPYRPPEDADRWKEFASPQARRVASPPVAPPKDESALGPAQLEAMIARYDAEIAYFDEHFGRLLAHLRERGLYDESLIVLTSDHGEEFYEHGGWAHAHTLYNDLLHVPLIAKYPARAETVPGTRDARLAALVDVVPTVADLLGARWPREALRGHSLLARPAGGDGARAVYADNESPPLRALIRGSDKLIQAVSEEGEVREEMHFSLDRDFAEQGDASVRLPESEATWMRRRLSDLSQERADTQEIRVDDDTYEELRALGYVE